jgi:cytochrome c553
MQARQRSVAWVPLFVLGVLLAQSGSACAGGPDRASGAGEAELLAIGQRIYRDGVLPSGRPLVGTAQANTQRVGADAACATCHRRSGYGSSEGLLEIRPITGPALFGAWAARPLDVSAVPVGSRLASAGSAGERVPAIAVRDARIAALSGTRQRPPYDDGSLARAVRDGLDIVGRRMNHGMPRYALDDDEMRALTAYLRTLSAVSSPGVTDDRIHFATVIQPGVDAAKRRAMVDVLQAYLEDRNRGLRAEVRREQAGSVQRGRTYREWVLSVWELSGPSDTWGAQLEAFNRRQPAFALISGLGAASWRPVHEFSERRGIPCIFPQTDLPVIEGPGFYTVYLSKGIDLEARALAQYLHDQGERGPVMQIFRREQASAAGADAFRKAWEAGAGAGVQDRLLDASPGPAFWRQLAKESPQSTLILWLRPQDLAHARALLEAGSPVKAVYLSSALSDGVGPGLGTDGDGRVRLVYPQDLPQVLDARLRPVERWLQSKRIPLSDVKVQMNAYLAVTVTTGVMSHSADTFSREFLLERVEHRMGNAYESSIYPHLSLGPGQRYASKGSYVVATGATDSSLTPLSGWLVP